MANEEPVTKGEIGDGSTEADVVDVEIPPVSAVILGLAQIEEGLLAVVSQITAVITLAVCLIWLPNVLLASIDEIIWDWFNPPSAEGSISAPDT